jgi:hypothetical protein
VRFHGIAIQIFRLYAVEFALLLGPSLAEGLFAAFLGGGLRHAWLGSR